MRRLLDALVDRSSLQNETELIHGNLNRRGYFSAGFWKFFLERFINFHELYSTMYMYAYI